MNVTSRSTLIAAAICAIVVAQSSAVSAQDARAKAKAKEHYDRALAYEKLKDWERAKREYESAFKLFPRPSFHYLIAEINEKLGDKQGALARYQRYVAEAPDGEVVEQAKRAIKRLSAELEKNENGGSASGNPRPPESVEGAGTSAEPPITSESRSVRANLVGQFVDDEDPPTRTHSAVAEPSERSDGSGLRAVGGLSIAIGLIGSGTGAVLGLVGEFDSLELGLTGGGAGLATIGLVVYLIGRSKRDDRLALVPGASQDSLGIWAFGLF